LLCITDQGLLQIVACGPGGKPPTPSLMIDIGVGSPPTAADWNEKVRFSILLCSLLLFKIPFFLVLTCYH